MTTKELRFKEGSSVIIELVEAKDASFCRFGYKVGDSWEVSIWENADLCGLAYYNFFPFITMLQTRGDAVWKPSERDTLLRTCPDLRPGFVFRIKRKG
jgi:uncharacterized repeat protein (TIGR04076 family)